MITYLDGTTGYWFYRDALAAGVPWWDGERGTWRVR